MEITLEQRDIVVVAVCFDRGPSVDAAVRNCCPTIHQTWAAKSPGGTAENSAGASLDLNHVASQNPSALALVCTTIGITRPTDDDTVLGVLGTGL
jgi:hypothetical protein